MQALRSGPGAGLGRRPSSRVISRRSGVGRSCSRGKEVAKPSGWERRDTWGVGVRFRAPRVVRGSGQGGQPTRSRTRVARADAMTARAAILPGSGRRVVSAVVGVRSTRPGCQPRQVHRAGGQRREHRPRRRWGKRQQQPDQETETAKPSQHRPYSNAWVLGRTDARIPGTRRASRRTARMAAYASGSRTSFFTNQ